MVGGEETGIMTATETATGENGETETVSGTGANGETMTGWKDRVIMTVAGRMHTFTGINTFIY
jgi:hypothetical protein